MSELITIDLGEFGDALRRAMLEEGFDKRQVAVVALTHAVTEVTLREMPAAISCYGERVLAAWRDDKREVLKNRLKQPGGLEMKIRLAMTAQTQ